MKILGTKRYKELIETEKKYRILIGECFTICSGARSTRQKLLMLDKEELVYYIYRLNNEANKFMKKVEENEKENKRFMERS